MWGEGEALAELEARSPDRRLINLETSVTSSEAAVPKGIDPPEWAGAAKAAVFCLADFCCGGPSIVGDAGEAAGDGADDRPVSVIDVPGSGFTPKRRITSYHLRRVASRCVSPKNGRAGKLRPA